MKAKKRYICPYCHSYRSSIFCAGIYNNQIPCGSRSKGVTQKCTRRNDKTYLHSLCIAFSVGVFGYGI